MNVREEDRQKNNCPSRGLGLAAAAIGVGVGAALYYFFSKRQENPDGEGSTSGWTCEQPHTLSLHENDHSYAMSSEEDHEDSYLTISEHSTTDTSVHDSGTDDESDENSGETSNEEDTEVESSEEELEISDSDSSETGYRTLPTFEVASDSDGMDWDITSSTIGLPPADSYLRSPSHLTMILERLRNLASHGPLSAVRKTTEEEQMTALRDQAFRERSWSLEECSICFDIILKDQQVTTLPCTHHFHSACIAPWLQEQQTCPNCRKAAE